MDIIFWIVGVVLGYLVYQVAKATIAIRREREQEQIDSVLARIVVMRIENDAQGFFSYDTRTGEFLSQGPTLEEMIKNFQSLYPNKTGLIIDTRNSSLRDIKDIATDSTKSLNFDSKTNYSSR